MKKKQRQSYTEQELLDKKARQNIFEFVESLPAHTSRSNQNANKIVHKIAIEYGYQCSILTGSQPGLNL